MEPSIPAAETTVAVVPVPRVVGPGRRERAYLEKLGRLESELTAAALVERGSSRRLDRMERKLAALREAAVALEQKEKRLILALGALQRENEMLREMSRTRALGSPGRPPRALPAPKRTLLGGLAHLFRRA